MKFLRENSKIFFKYGGIEFANCEKTQEIKEENNILTTVYLVEEKLKITNIAKKISTFGAYEWVTYFENIGETDTKNLTEIFDCDISVPFQYDEKPKSIAFLPNYNSTKIINPTGSTCTEKEFYSDPEKVVPGSKPNYIFSGDEKYFAATGGRSSQELAPFFEVNRIQKGIIFAIGWTGQWHCKISRNDTEVNIKTGIQNVNFKLHPKEKIRTSSILLMPYENGQINAHNKFRRIIKKDFSIFNNGKKPPFSQMLWGGISSDKMIERINKIGKNNLEYKYIWIDAGWYGSSTIPCPSDFDGNWGAYTGDWRVNPNYHPDMLKDVSKTVKENNMKLLLWFEPERVIKNTPITNEHPEYFLKIDDTNEWIKMNFLLDLGNEEAYNYCLETIIKIIDDLKIDCYRQDFNFDPLQYWIQNSEQDRIGILEIKHICGLYKLWDELLARFPNLIIDNCASGGRRIDIETLKRSIPLWRSDYQCQANCDEETSQMHSMCFNYWLPYTGMGNGRVMNDTYRARSFYAPALSNGYWFTENETFTEDKETIDWIRKVNLEYLMIRDYLTCDFYPLTEASNDNSAWCAARYDRPEENDGIVLIYKRKNSPYTQSKFIFENINTEKNYVFTDIDTKKSVEFSGKQLLEHGFEVEILEKRVAKIYMYKENKCKIQKL